MNEEKRPMTAEENARNVMRMAADVQERQANLFRELEEGGKALAEIIRKEAELKVKPIILLEELTKQNEELHKQNEKLNKLTKLLIALTFVLVIFTLISIYLAFKTIN